MRRLKTYMDFLALLFVRRDAAVLRKRLQAEVRNLRVRVDKCTIRVSKCAETYVEFFGLHHEYDAFLVSCEPSNPWTSDSTDFWDLLSKEGQQGIPAERRVRRWAFSCWDLLRDKAGHDHFRAFLEKEYATENLLFVEAVWRMKKMAQSGVTEECARIWRQFLGPGAEMLVNVDSKTHRVTEENMRSGPDRWTFDDAAAHLYYLMTSDSYSRYLRSSHYKDFLETAKKKSGGSSIRNSFGLNKLAGGKLNIVSSSSGPTGPNSSM